MNELKENERHTINHSANRTWCGELIDNATILADFSHKECPECLILHLDYIEKSDGARGAV